MVENTCVKGFPIMVASNQMLLITRKCKYKMEIQWPYIYNQMF